LVKGGRRKVKIGECAAFATIGDRDSDALALVCSPNPLVAKRVVVRVGTIVAGIGVEEEMGHGSNVIRVLVHNTTSTKTSGIESTLAGLSTRHEAEAAVVTTRWSLGGSRRSGSCLGSGRRGLGGGGGSHLGGSGLSLRSLGSGMLDLNLGSGGRLRILLMSSGGLGAGNSKRRGGRWARLAAFGISPPSDSEVSAVSDSCGLSDTSSNCAMVNTASVMAGSKSRH